MGVRHWTWVWGRGVVDRPLSGKEESALRGRNEARRVRIGGAARVVIFSACN